ncbi:MAG: PHP domain-containing protein [Planctomycetes bacterium]|nr:PHP domain-containing protein [Planctomycetota bacterium]
MTVDLHLHTLVSDGAVTPTELVRRATLEGHQAIAISDHDTTAGLAEAARAARVLEGAPQLIPAIELTVQIPHGGTVHVLGYGVDPAAPELAEVAAENRAGKRARMRAILAGLKEREGISVSYEELAAGRGEDAYVGRHHAAAILVRRGIVKTRQKAFRRYLKDSRVPEPVVVDAARGLAAIRAAGGVTVLAHPTPHDLKKHFKSLLKSGLDGLEVHRPRGAASHRERVGALAAQEGLLVTGGSDWHGHYPDPPFGHWAAPDRLLEPLLAAISARGGQLSLL